MLIDATNSAFEEQVKAPQYVAFVCSVVMLLILLVAMFCVTRGAAEFECSGQGRFSTTPGFCTNEYYTCNREPNRQYIAYVLSCPGHTLFNEKTRRCSNAKTVLCTVAINTKQTGKQSSPVKVTTTRSLTLKAKTSPGLFTYRIYPSSTTTTKRKTQLYRKPGRPSRFTWKPFRATLPMKTEPIRVVNQWRIKLSATKRKSTSPWTKILTSATRPTKAFARTTSTRVKQWRFKQSTTKRKSTSPWTKTLTLATQPTKSFIWTTSTTNFTTTPTPLFHKISPTVPVQTTEVLPQKISTKINEFNHFHITPIILNNANRTESRNASLKPTPPDSTQFLKTSSSTEPDLKLIEFDKNKVKYNNATYVTKISDLTKVKKPSIPQSMTSSQQMEYHRQITARYVTRPTMMSTTPKTSASLNVYFETTPGVTQKNYEKNVPFIDALEGTDNNNVMKIVYVTENSQYVPSTTIIQRQRNKEGQKNTESPIQYFFDQDIHNGKSSHLKIKENQPKIHGILSSDNSPSNNVQKSRRKLISRTRQPKQSTDNTNI